MSKIRTIIGIFGFTAFSLVAAIGCDGEGSSNSEVTLGSEVVNLGIEFVDMGIVNFRASDHDGGMTQMERGIRMIDGGLETMHVGIERFSGDDHPMMWGCDESHADMMAPMDSEAMRLHGHLAQLRDEDPTNDEAAVQEMEKGVQAMRGRMDGVDMARHCNGGHPGHD